MSDYLSIFLLSYYYSTTALNILALNYRQALNLSLGGPQRFNRARVDLYGKDLANSHGEV